MNMVLFIETLKGFESPQQCRRFPVALGPLASCFSFGKRTIYDPEAFHPGANIFLTSSGLIKLGDFGCSVKLKNNTQTMPGEVNSTLGTAAYMAPEVITRAKGEGHGRAADIWSLGCVVIEMVTGKRPWHEYEHNFQIMYKVGMGHKPPIPDKVSPEGKDFLCHCLESDPKMRWTASQLLDHPFVKVCTDEE